jgi:PAS domain S-box-containing protein
LVYTAANNAMQFELWRRRRFELNSLGWKCHRLKVKRRRNLQASGRPAAQAGSGTGKKTAKERLATETLSRTNEELEAAKAELEKLNETLTALFQFAPDAIVTVDAAGRIARANTQAESLFGYTHQELAGQPIEMLMPARFQKDHVQHREDYISEPRLRAMGAGLELYGRRKGGNEFPVDIMLSPIATQEGRGVIAIVRDITERKQAEEARCENRKSGLRCESGSGLRSSRELTSS